MLQSLEFWKTIDNLLVLECGLTNVHGLKYSCNFLLPFPGNGKFHKRWAEDWPSRCNDIDYILRVSCFSLTPFLLFQFQSCQTLEFLDKYNPIPTGLLYASSISLPDHFSFDIHLFIRILLKAVMRGWLLEFSNKKLLSDLLRQLRYLIMCRTEAISFLRNM